MCQRCILRQMLTLISSKIGPHVRLSQLDSQCRQLRCISWLSQERVIRKASGCDSAQPTYLDVHHVELVLEVRGSDEGGDAGADERDHGVDNAVELLHRRRVQRLARQTCTQSGRISIYRIM